MKLKGYLLIIPLIMAFQIQAIGADKNGNLIEVAERFSAWKQTLRPDMLAQGASEPLVDQIIDSLRYLPKVIELDRRQPEGTMSHEQYLTRVIPERKVKAARAEFKRHRVLLEEAQE